MRLVLLEDEPLAMAHLRAAVLAARPDAGIDAELATLADARTWFATHSAPDLVISDIVLGDGNALTLFRDGVVQSPVVFATAHDDFLLGAFRCASIDYLLKPIATSDVARALEKHRTMKTLLSSSSSSSSSFGAVADVVAEPRRRLLARRGSEVRAVDVEDIAYFVADDKLTLLITRDGSELVIDRSLAALDDDLADFFRANRASLVRRSAVKSFRSLGKGRIELKLEPQRIVVVSQENGAAFRAWISRDI